MEEETIKYFNGNRYCLYYDRWKRSSWRNQFLLSHDIWNYYNPNDRIKPKDGFVIHHINGDAGDDRIENLQKVIDSKHRKMHTIGKNNPAGIDGRTLDKNEYNRKFINVFKREKSLFYFSDKTNHFYYRDMMVINKKTETITISHSWGYY